jgi:hypothetical protein
MDVTLQIPDDIASRMTEAGVDLSRRALESFALEEFKSGRITKPELRRLLGYGTRWKLDGFLKAHGVYEDYTLEDFEQERQALRSLEF